MNFSVIILDSGFRIPDSGFRIPDSGFWIPDSAFRIPVSRFRIPVSGFRLLGLPLNRLTVVCETKWDETKWISVVCEMEICSLRNENL